MQSKILIFSHDNKIGDAILLTSLLKPIKLKWPHCEIDVVCGKDNAAVWKFNEAINHIYVLPSRSILVRILYGLIIRINSPSFAIVANGECQGKSFFMFRMAANIKKIFWLSTEKNASSTDTLIFGDWNSGHYLHRCRALIKVITGKETKPKIDFIISKSSNNFALNYWIKKLANKTRKIIINIAGSSEDRSFSVAKVNEFCNGLANNLSHIQLFIISYNKKHEKFLRTYFRKTHLVNIIPPRKSILDIAALLRSSDLIITPDTSSVHIASAFSKKIVCIYTSKQAALNWGPLSKYAKTVFADMLVENVSTDEVVEAAVTLLK